ncbi:lipid A export permease/ATP-binding protein MsbA [Chromobacterium violaceum]|uniref:lipid A export permease/ATP-binding protein MsbA n=1 Tax=Chromobacterium violaceum TaxID=536 RepID=UPI0009DB0DA3|nr:lipid A export permease/ATP-binding protein MsbA [Chromobacterium violaceum]OQS30654.1 lipid A export permease/ATP-binding protein MsbA [Chromobacterium violaceum]
MTKNGFKDSWAIYRRLLGYLLGYWKVLLLSMLSMAVAALTEPAVAKLLKPLIDGGFVNKDPQVIMWVPLAIIGIYLIRGLAGFINEYTASWLTGQLVQRLRQQMFAKLVNLPARYYDEHQSGRLMSRITNDVNQVTEAGFNVITVTVRDGLTALGMLGLMLTTDWQLTLICLVVMPAITYCMRLVGQRLRGLARQNQQHMAQMTQVLAESIQCQRAIKVYGGQEREMARFDHTATSVRRNQVKQSAASAANTGVTQLMIACALAAILYFAGLRAQHGGLTAGDFMVFLTAMLGLFAPVKRISSVSQAMQRGLAAAESVFAFIDEPGEPDDGASALPATRGRLRFDAVSFAYPNVDSPALSGIDLEIQPGETVALVGSSGSGKTTLASLVPRFYEPSAGRLLLDGVPLADIPLRQLRGHIALVSQQVELFNDTVAANIAYGREDASREEIVEAARAANAMEFIEGLSDGLETVIGENGARLSGGQRQRLAIARALLKNAPLLILDEATSALDTQSERLVQAALENLMKNRTTIVIAHRLSTIENADRIVVMHQGRLAEQGRHQALLEQGGLYARLHSLQFSEPQAD